MYPASEFRSGRETGREFILLNLIQDVATRGEVEFAEVSSQSREIALLHVYGYGKNAHDNLPTVTFRFRNVPIQ